MEQRITLGVFDLDWRTIQVSARPGLHPPTAWLNRIAPAPAMALGYVTGLDSPIPALTLYTAEWDRALRERVKAETARIWAEHLAAQATEPDDTGPEPDSGSTYLRLG